ncbi:PK beta-barrel-protein domain-containing protein-like protein [Lepidopterella palustris CBS 459.81]|uniref:PK beta-barrel-protein domain-containing protein-like protein n=1 Tax=Lepidopterella palustris CBS 459.81 TaxID=1314670 RepID=A0A8E2DYR6_9PEZI|nr:PK beta-barrel-protein domain-containing protein-like protein [Lepidopterella palustris CBS 459.81]
MATQQGTVTAVSRSISHQFSKDVVHSITLVTGIGVENDAHAGVTVQHLPHLTQDPTRPNFRQVHLIHYELFYELGGRGFDVRPGQLGENITTYGIDLLALPQGTRLKFGNQATVEITGLRSPGPQIERFKKGLLGQVFWKDNNGHLVRKAGVMGIVLVGGPVKAGDIVQVYLPAEPHRALGPV